MCVAPVSDDWLLFFFYNNIAIHSGVALNVDGFLPVVAQHSLRWKNASSLKQCLSSWLPRHKKIILYYITAARTHGDVSGEYAAGARNCFSIKMLLLLFLLFLICLLT